MNLTKLKEREQIIRERRDALGGEEEPARAEAEGAQPASIE
jgi:hypothetical protein